MTQKRVKLKKINNESLVGTGNITVLTSHQSLADCLQKSQTTGLVKNDGTIDENNYALATHNHSGTYANATHTHTQSQVTDLTLSSLGGVVTVEEQQTADTGFTKTYVVKQNGSQVGSKINIPKDFLVKSATVQTVTVANTPVNGYVSGDKYLDFIINSKDGTATDEHLYVLVSDLVDTEIDWSNVQNKPTIPSKTSDLNNDSGFLTSHQDITGKEDTSNKVTSISSSSTNTQYPSAKCVYDEVDSLWENIPDTNDFELVICKVNDLSLYTSDTDMYPSAKAVADYIDNALPTSLSDLTNDINCVTTSSASSTTPLSDVSGGSSGSSTNYSRADHQHQLSDAYARSSHTHSAYVNPTICDNLTTNDATQVLSAKQGKVLNDLIGQAISYINQ